MKIKALTAIIAAILMIICVFSGCKGQEISEEETETNDVSVSEESSEAPVSEPVSSAPESTAEPTTAGESTTADASTTEATTAAPTTAAPTTAAPTTTTPVTTTAAQNTVNVSEAASKIASQSIFEETLSAGSVSRALAVFGISSSDVIEAAYYTASAAVAEEVLVVKATSSDAASAVARQMESRKAMQIEDYRDYVPKEVTKLQSAVIYTDGNYAVYCVSSDNSAAKKFITSLF